MYSIRFITVDTSASLVLVQIRTYWYVQLQSTKEDLKVGKCIGRW